MVWATKGFQLWCVGVSLVLSLLTRFLGKIAWFGVIDWCNSSMVEEMRSLLSLKLANSSFNHTECSILMSYPKDQSFKSSSKARRLDKD